MDTGKGFGFVVIILIWGGLLYFLTSGSFLTDIGADKLFASVFPSFASGSSNSSEPSGIKGIITIFDENNKENFQATEIHFDKSIDVSEIKVSPNNPKLVFAASNYGLFISRDAGLNWYNFSDFEHNIDSNTIIYKILFANDKSYISVFKNNQGIVYESSDNFFSLKKLFEIQGEAAYDFDVSGGNLYLGLSNGKLMIYSLAKDELRVLTNFSSPITELKVQAGGLIYLTLKSGGFWVSVDGGQSFSREKFLDDYRGANKISEFITSYLNDTLVYAVTDYGLIRSFNAGSAWQVFKSLPVETPKISAFSVKDNSGEIFVASNGKIYISRDNGLNWQIFDSGLNNRQISVINYESKEIIIGTTR